MSKPSKASKSVPRRKMEAGHGIERRAFLKGTAAALMGGLAASNLPTQAAESPRADRRPSLVKTENERSGALDWQLTRVRLDKTTGFRSPWIEGYCSRQSVEAGETIDIMVST